MTDYRAEGLTQVLTFVCLVAVPTIPFRFFVAPVTLIYSFFYWIVYWKAAEVDIGVEMAILLFMRNTVLTVCIAYVTQSAPLRAYKEKDDPQTMLGVME